MDCDHEIINLGGILDVILREQVSEVSLLSVIIVVVIFFIFEDRWKKLVVGG